MPTFEGTCSNEACQENGRLFEYLLKKWDDPDPQCPACKSQILRYMSAPNIVWVKGIGQYCGENTDGHWASARNLDTGQVEKQFIATRQDQKEFCKRNGFYDPAEIPSVPTAGRDGKERNTRGEKGTWI